MPGGEVKVAERLSDAIPPIDNVLLDGRSNQDWCTYTTSEDIHYEYRTSASVRCIEPTGITPTL